VSNAENQPTGHGPKGWLEKGPSASLLVRYVSHRICSSLTPRIPTLLKPTVCLLLVTRCTRTRRRATTFRIRVPFNSVLNKISPSFLMTSIVFI